MSMKNRRSNKEAKKPKQNKAKVRGLVLAVPPPGTPIRPSRRRRQAPLAAGQ
jgi:hypothetical protein